MTRVSKAKLGVLGLASLSPQSASCVNSWNFQLAYVSTTLDDIIMSRITFLQDQLAGEDDPAYIRTFITQIRILRTAQLERLEELIAIRKNDLKNSKNIIESDMMFAELEALEWLQRQALRHT